MEHDELKRIVEALIFVAEEPLSAAGIEVILAESDVSRSAVRQAVEAVQEDYRARRGGIELREVAGGFQFRTRPVMREWIQRLNVPKPMRLSQAAMETLAIVAYQQPVVRADIEDIRGVDCGGVLKTILERHLIKIVGKRDEPGTPLLYGTTKEFLSLFNLENLTALPSLREYRALEQASATMEVEGVDTGADIPDEAAVPLSVEAQIHQQEVDQKVIDDLEDQIRSLRNLEGDIFPKPVQTITLVPTEDATPADEPSAPLTEEQQQSS
jgi:segregation and condensation protein B